MEDLKTVEGVVRSILVDYPDARNSDNILYSIYVGKVNPDVLHMPVSDYLLHFKDFGLYRFESLARTRRRIQEDEPELRGVEDVRRWRNENEKQFYEYAKEIR